MGMCVCVCVFARARVCVCVCVSVGWALDMGPNKGLAHNAPYRKITSLRGF